MRELIPVHGVRGDHRANGPDPMAVLLHKVVFGDEEPVASTGGQRYLTITPDLAGTYLRSAHAALVVVGGAVSIQVHNVDEAVDMLAVPITIQAGERTSYTAATYAEVDTAGTPANNRVSLADQIRIDVDTPSGTGLELLLEFGPQLLRLS